MLFVLISLSCFSAINAFPNQNELQNIYRHLQKADEFNKIITEAAKQLDPSSSLLTDELSQALQDQIIVSERDNTTGCACKGYNCGCCLHLSWKEVGLDDSVCTNFSYLPAPEYGISVTLTVGDKTIFNWTGSARNPPPVCAAIPYLKKFASLCLKFENLQFTNKSLSGCVYITAKLEGLKVDTIKLGCFKIPPGNETVTLGSRDSLLLKAMKKTSDAKQLSYWRVPDSSKLYFKPLKNN